MTSHIPYLSRSDHMNKRTWTFALAAPALALTGIGAASAASDGPVLSDEAVTDATTGDEAEVLRHGPGRGHRGGRALFGAVAEAMGLEPGELRDQLDQDTTLADVASANGVDIDAVIAAVVDEAQVRADEEGHDRFDAETLTERLTKLANGERPTRGPEGPGHRGRRGPASDSVQELLGLDAAQIHEALRGGQTLAEVAEAQGVSLDQLVGTIVADIEAQMEESGREFPDGVTADDLEERVTDRVTSEHQGRRRGPHGPGGHSAGHGHHDEAVDEAV